MAMTMMMIAIVIVTSDDDYGNDDDHDYDGGVMTSVMVRPCNSLALFVSIHQVKNNLELQLRDMHEQLISEQNRVETLTAEKVESV